LAPTQQAILDILEYDHIFNEVKTYTPPNGVPLSALGAYIISKKIEAKTLD
jgi:2-dehydro-3-deoxygalactonokinase